jgi:hypothetical protein
MDVAVPKTSATTVHPRTVVVPSAATAATAADWDDAAEQAELQADQDEGT